MTRQLIITNRALPLEYSAGELPRRIHIVPRGELYNKAAGVTQVLDDKAIDSILADLQDVKAKNGGLYLGEEHFIYNSDMSSQAFCWGKKFEKDERGIWAVEPEFTDVGTPAIQNRRFKWTSFVADAETPGAVEKLANGKVRILKIDTVGFTNYANGKSLLTPITNRQLIKNYSSDQERDAAGKFSAGGGDFASEVKNTPLEKRPTIWGREGKRPMNDEEFHEHVTKRNAMNSAKADFDAHVQKTLAPTWGTTAKGSTAMSERLGNKKNFTDSGEPVDSKPTNQTKNKKMKTVCTLLGLSADADESSVHAAVAKLQNRVTELEPLATENTVLKNRVTSIDGEQCEALLTECHVPADFKGRTHLLNSVKTLKNRDERLSHLADFGFTPQKKAAAPAQRMLNRNDGTQRGTTAAQSEQERCAQIQSGVGMIRNRDKCNLDTAMQTLRAEKPELFPATENAS